MKRIACLVVLLLAGTFGTAQAQVATTDLVPAAPTFLGDTLFGLNGANVTPDNPAAIAWGKPSRWAVGYIKGTDTASVSKDFSGEFGGARMVGQTFAFATELTNVKDGSSYNQGTLDQSGDGQVSLNLGSLALGLGYGASSSDPGAIDMTRTEAGASLRMNEVWYLGLGAYQDKVTPTNSSSTYKRTGTMAGLALRTEGEWHWYLAYDYIKLNNFSVSGTSEYGSTHSRMTVQLEAGPVLLGGSSGKVNNLTSLSTNDWKVNTVDLGYAPMKGLTLTARSQTTTGTTSTEKITTHSVNVGWMF